MKRIFCLPLLILFCAVCLADITIVQNVQTGAMMGQPAKNLTMTMYVKGTKARIETKESPNYQILDLQTNKIYNVNPAEKKTMSMSMDLMKHAGDMMGKMGEMKTDVKKTGASSEVNGFKCDEYVVTITGPISGSTTECVTQDVDTSEFDKFRDFAMNFAHMMGSDKMPQIKGLPVRTASKISLMGQSMESKSEVQSISTKSIEDSIFTVPPGYAVQEMPGM